MSSNPPQLVTLRAEITDDEWTALRVLALQNGMTAQQFVGQLIRDRIQQNRKAA